MSIRARSEDLGPPVATGIPAVKITVEQEQEIGKTTTTIASAQNFSYALELAGLFVNPGMTSRAKRLETFTCFNKLPVELRRMIW